MAGWSGRTQELKIAISANKNLKFCTYVGISSIEDKYINTYRTLEDLKTECNYIIQIVC
jgi:hypothetical protein